MFNNQILLVFGFAIAIFVIVITIYLIRNRENLIRNPANLIPEPPGPFVSYENIKDMYISYNSDNGDLSSNSIEELLSKPINDGIINAYKHLRDKLADKVETNYVSADQLFANSFNLLPPGVIVAYNGDVAPFGWAICDGTGGTPDLKGRFILGSGPGSGLTNRTLNATGGTETVKLTVQQMPTHAHNYSTLDHEQRGLQGGRDVDGNQKARWTTRTSDNQGGNQPHENMPPYYVLTYIMKT